MASEEYSIIGVYDPAKITSSTVKTDAFNMSKYSKVMAIILEGAFSTGGTLDAKIKFSATSNGTFTTGVTGKYITQITEAGTSSNKQAIINLNAAEACSTTKKWALVHMTAGGGSQSICAIVLGKPVRTEAFTTIAANDLASVVEIVA